MTSPGEPQVLRPFHRSEAFTIADAALKAASCPSPLSRAFWLRGASRRFHHLTRPVASSLPGGLEHGVFNQFLHPYELATRPTACAALRDPRLALGAPGSRPRWSAKCASSRPRGAGSLLPSVCLPKLFGIPKGWDALSGVPRLWLRRLLSLRRWQIALRDLLQLLDTHLLPGLDFGDIDDVAVNHLPTVLTEQADMLA